RRRSVRADGHELHLRRDRQSAREVGHEEDGALEHPDEQQIAFRRTHRVTLGDRLRQLCGPLLDLLFGDQHRRYVVLVHRGTFARSTYSTASVPRRRDTTNLVPVRGPRPTATGPCPRHATTRSSTARSIVSFGVAV